MFFLLIRCFMLTNRQRETDANQELLLLLISNVKSVQSNWLIAIRLFLDSQLHWVNLILSSVSPFCTRYLWIQQIILHFTGRLDEPLNFKIRNSHFKVEWLNCQDQNLNLTKLYSLPSPPCPPSPWPLEVSSIMSHGSPSFSLFGCPTKSQMHPKLSSIRPCGRTGCQRLAIGLDRCKLDCVSFQ